MDYYFYITNQLLEKHIKMFYFLQAYDYISSSNSGSWWLVQLGDWVLLVPQYGWSAVDRLHPEWRRSSLKCMFTNVACHGNWFANYFNSVFTATSLVKFYCKKSQCFQLLTRPCPRQNDLLFHRQKPKLSICRVVIIIVIIIIIISMRKVKKMKSFKLR